MKKIEKNKEYLFKIIDKLLNGSISSKEIEELINYSQSFQDATEWDTDLGLEEDVKNKIQSKIAASINPKKKKSKIIRLQPFIKYAAIGLLLISITATLFNTNFSDQTVTEKALKNIQPGVNKATLILGNGSKIDLTTKKQVIASNGLTKIKNNGRKLSYTNATITAKTEPIPYNTLIVPTGGMYQVELPDGTQVWLNSKSKLRYPVKFTGNERKIELTGEAYFEVTKSKNPFIVQTATASVTVLGTHFNISSYPDDKTFATTLVEGSVKLTNKNSSVILKPGEQGSVVTDSKKGILKITKVDTSVFTAWTKGKFYFENEKLGQILAKMSRWYNIEFHFDDESIKDEVFTGVVLRNKTIDNLLSKICQITNINYKITKENEKYVLNLFRN